MGSEQSQVSDLSDAGAPTPVTDLRTGDCGTARQAIVKAFVNETIHRTRGIDSFHDAILVRTWGIAPQTHYACEDLGGVELTRRGIYGETHAAVVRRAATGVREAFDRLTPAEQARAVGYWLDKEETLLACARDVSARLHKGVTT